MNFSSLKEYFYKLYNASMKTLLVPVAAFLLIYYFFLSGLILPPIQDEVLIYIMLAAYLVIIVSALTIVHLEANKFLKFYADVVGLGKKLDLFYLILQKRMKATLWISIFTSSGFILTGHAWFSIYFGVIVLWFIFQWPLPRKVANQMKLKGDERTMVMTKGEAFRF